MNEVEIIKEDVIKRMGKRLGITKDDVKVETIKYEISHYQEQRLRGAVVKINKEWTQQKGLVTYHHFEMKYNYSRSYKDETSFDFLFNYNGEYTYSVTRI